MKCGSMNRSFTSNDQQVVAWMFYSCPTCSELLCVVSRDLGTGCDWLTAREGGGEMPLTGGVEASKETANQSQALLYLTTLLMNYTVSLLFILVIVLYYMTKESTKIIFGDFNIDINIFAILYVPYNGLHCKSLINIYCGITD